MRKIILLITIILLPFACKPTKTLTSNTNTINSDNIEGRWKLTYINNNLSQGKSTEELFLKEIPHLTFNALESSFSGTDGCNIIGGYFIINNKKQISIKDEIFSTRMFCEGVSDDLFHQVLKQVDSYDIVNDDLFFFSKNSKIMHFVKQRGNEEDNLNF